MLQGINVAGKGINVAGNICCQKYMLQGINGAGNNFFRE
jgi:hypothetical protein